MYNQRLCIHVCKTSLQNGKQTYNYKTDNSQRSSVLPIVPSTEAVYPPSALRWITILSFDQLFLNFAINFDSIQVLATGLSALYSDLPTTCSYSMDEWQSPLPVIEASVPELGRFYQALDFCNSVLQVLYIYSICAFVCIVYTC